MRTGRWGRELGCVLVLAFVLPTACGGDDAADALRRAKLAEGCVINSDCGQKPDPLICAFRLCHVQCNTSADCDKDLRCVLGTKPEHVCLLPDEQTCKSSASCPEELACGPDGECRDKCSSDNDCVLGQICTQGLCADKVELVNGKLPSKLGDGGQDSAPPGTSCSYSSECPGNQICKSGSCVLQCLGNKDCSPGTSCVGNVCGAGWPADASADSPVQTGAPCKLNSDCTAPLICSVGSCELECKTAVDCPPGKQCIGNRCLFEAPVGAPPGYGQACALTSQCPGGLYCISGACVFECVNNLDCNVNAGYCCAQNSCLKGGALCNADAGPGDGGPPPDASTGKTCGGDLECQDNSLCNGIEQCVKGYCYLGEPPCDDLNPCTADSCSETAGCTHTPTGPQDVDKDGHFAVACGSGADDCDDADPKVYGGAPELCDQKDNNCNGHVDEGLWKAQAATTIATGPEYAGKQVFENVPGAPVLIRLPDGSFRVFALNDGPNQNGTGTTSIRAFKLDASLAVQGSAVEFASGNNFFAGLTAATDGTGIAFGATVNTTTVVTQKTTVFRTDSALGTPTTTALNTLAGWNYASGALIGASRPALAWNGSDYVLVWQDSHADATTHRLYAATMSPAGLVSTQHLLDPVSPLATTYYTVSLAQPAVAVGGSSALVAWSCPDAGGWHLCTAVAQKNLASLTTPPLKAWESTGGSTFPTSVTHVGSSFIVAWQRGTTLGLTRFHETTGAVLKTISLESPLGGGDLRVAAVAGGVALTAARGLYLSYLWIPESLDAASLIFTDLAPATTMSGISIAPVDASTFAIVYQDGALRARLVKCQP